MIAPVPGMNVAGVTGRMLSILGDVVSFPGKGTGETKSYLTLTYLMMQHLVLPVGE